MRPGRETGQGTGACDFLEDPDCFDLFPGQASGDGLGRRSVARIFASRYADGSGPAPVVFQVVADVGTLGDQTVGAGREVEIGVVVWCGEVVQFYGIRPSAVMVGLMGGGRR